MKKPKIIEDKDFKQYRKNLESLMKQVNPKPFGKRKRETIIAELRKERGM